MSLRIRIGIRIRDGVMGNIAKTDASCAVAQSNISVVVVELHWRFSIVGHVSLLGLLWR